MVTHLWEKVDHAAQEYRREELDSKRYPPFPTISGTSPCHVTAVPDPACQYLTQSVEQLLQASDLAANFAVRDLSLEDWNDQC